MCSLKVIRIKSIGKRSKSLIAIGCQAGSSSSKIEDCIVTKAPNCHYSKDIAITMHLTLRS